MTDRVSVTETASNELLDDYVRRIHNGYFQPNQAALQRILSSEAVVQRLILRAAIDRTRERRGDSWVLHELIGRLLRRKLPLTHDDMMAILAWATDHCCYAGSVIRAVEMYTRRQPLTEPLRDALAELKKGLVTDFYMAAEQRRAAARIDDLLGEMVVRVPFAPGELWSDTALAEISTCPPPERAAWTQLLAACAHAAGSAPSHKWLKTVQPFVETIGGDRFTAALLRWLPLVDQGRPTTRAADEPWIGRDPRVLNETNADILKGLVWLCAERQDTELTRALAALAVSTYRTIPGIGPLSPRVGNACIWALGHMPGMEGIGQLAVLKMKIRYGGGQRAIETAIQRAAERLGLQPDEVEELCVPSYGMEAVGLRSQSVGDVRAELAARGPHEVELRWLRADGKRLSSPPRAVKQQHGALVKELSLATTEIKKTLAAQRDRIERLYLAQRRWELAAWRERYLEHPLVGVLTRRLIWRFADGERSAAGIWHDGRIVGHDGRPLGWLSEAAQVELWHPLSSSTDEVLAWRSWLGAHQIRQPFKQAHREIYLLTDAERATATYSNRFAAHIIRQHQFNALCAARGWKNSLRLMVDDSLTPPSRLLPQWGLRAEFWVDSVGDNYGVDTNATGTYLYLATDQVRFYPIEAQEHYTHATGGGYASYAQVPAAPQAALPLEQITPLVFSEILRDVDLFVGVASVGNDPTWADGGPEGRFRDYWQRYSFGELSQSAKTRREVLEQLIPRLKIRDRAHLSERFLVVRGELRTYKIHLGSGNILMEPNDQYLCIVPARSAAGTATGETVTLPFEGDGILAIILSKALLLADDTRITDPSIVSQIQR